jgi:hypothetical protein
MNCHYIATQADALERVGLFDIAARQYLRAASIAPTRMTEHILLLDAWINFERGAGRRSELDDSPSPRSIDV